MNDNNMHRFILVGISLSLIGAIIALVLAYLFPHWLFAMIGSMMILTLGAGLSSPILNRLTIEASNAPMGTSVAMDSMIRTTLAVIASGLISFAYNGTLLSLATILIAFSGVAFLLKLTAKKDN